MMSATSRLRTFHPHAKSPLVVSAPVRPFAQHELATATTLAGGVGFISSTPSDAKELAAAASLLSSRSFAYPSSSEPSVQNLLPIGIGYLIWLCSLPSVLKDLRARPVQAVWLYAWRSTEELKSWIHSLQAEFPSTAIYVQVCDLDQALLVPTLCRATSRLVLIVQGADAGGHGAVCGSGLMTLLPEVKRALRSHGLSDIPVLAAGGVISAEGAAAALALGADGLVLGTRAVASKEAKVPDGFRRYIVSANNGAKMTLRTRLFDELRGTAEFPEYYNARALVNASVRDTESGMCREDVLERFQGALSSATEKYGVPPLLKERPETAEADEGYNEYGPDGRLVCYIGNGVGLVQSIDGMADIIAEIQSGIQSIVGGLPARLGQRAPAAGPDWNGTQVGRMLKL